MIRQHSFEVNEPAARLQAWVNPDFQFEANLRRDQRCCLESSFQWTGDNRVEADVQRIQVSADQQTLLFSLFIEAAFTVDERISPAGTGTGMAENVKDHKEWS